MRICWSLEIWLQISSQVDNVKLRIKDGVYEKKRGQRRINRGHTSIIKDILQEGGCWMMVSLWWTLSEYAVAEIELLLDRQANPIYYIHVGSLNRYTLNKQWYLLSGTRGYFGYRSRFGVDISKNTYPLSSSIS